MIPDLENEKKEKKEKRNYLGMSSKKYIRERKISLYFR